MATAQDLQSKIDAAVTANEAGDFATALTQLRSAKMILAGLSDRKIEDLEISYDRAAIDAMIDDIKRAQNASAGICRTPVKFVRPSA